MTLKELTLTANLGLSGTQFWVWFDGCELKGHVLSVPSEEAKASIERLFGGQLRKVSPDLCLVVSRAPVRRPSPLKASAPPEIKAFWD